MAARSPSISLSVGRVASKEARAMKAARSCAVIVSALLLAAPPRDDVGFVKEPQAAVLAQHFPGGVKIAAVVDDLRQTVVLDLGHVDSGVPGGEQGRGAD